MTMKSIFHICSLFACAFFFAMNMIVSLDDFGGGLEFTSRTRHNTLWLVVCETRHNSSDLSTWMDTAVQFQHLSQSGTIRVEIENVCKGEDWGGLTTKPKILKRFLSGLNSTDAVIFTDSDALFNPWAATAEEVLDRFDLARKGRKILFSAEPACWIGRPCTQEDVLKLMGNKPASTCPQFLNSGQYMGEAEHLIRMLDWVLDPVNERGLAEHGWDSFESDQMRLANWWSKNRNEAQLDVQARVFRGLGFGTITPIKKINVTKKAGRTCGIGSVKECGTFLDPFSAFLNTSSGIIEMEPVPTCPAEVAPFSIHGPGPYKPLVGELHKQLYLPAAPSHSVRKDAYTIVISSFDRFEQMSKILPHWRSCPYVHEIHIVHHHPKKPVPEYLHNFTTAPFVKVFWHTENKLTNRFRADHDFETELVLHIDDDMVADCRLVSAAFQYRKKNPSTITGLAPRSFDLNSTGQGYKYNAACKKELDCSYNTVWSTKGAFLTVSEMQRYWDATWSNVRSLVDDYITGEDMLMSVVLGNPPLPHNTFGDKNATLAACPNVGAVFPMDWHQPKEVTRPKASNESLGVRTSQHRPEIREQLAQLVSGLCTPKTKTWIAVDTKGGYEETKKACHGVHCDYIY